MYGDDIVAMGLAISDLGTHSCRKGAATDLSNCPGGPQSVAIWLRVGWSLGPVQGRYIFSGSGGDQFVGRAAAGLEVNNFQFSILPPHFDGESLSCEEWEVNLPGYRTFYPESFRSTIPFLLASLVFHRRWLQDNLHELHPLFLAPVWTSGIIASLGSRVFTGYLDNEITGLRASGMPPTVVFSRKLQRVEEQIGTVR